MDFGASIVGSTNLSASCRYEGETWLQREDLEEGQAVVVVVVVVLVAVTPCILHLGSGRWRDHEEVTWIRKCCGSKGPPHGS